MLTFHSLHTWLKRLPGIALIVLIYFLLAPSPAQAFYIDPGTGSVIIQILLGFMVGGLFALKIYWTRFSDWLKRSVNLKDKHEEP